MQAESDEPTSDSVAGRYLTVRLEKVPRSRWRRFLAHAGPVAEFLTPVPDIVFETLLPWSTEPKDPALVQLVRRSDGTVLTTYEHDYLLDAIGHRDSLTERLSSDHIYDLCRQLGIDIKEIGAPSEP